MISWVFELTRRIEDSISTMRVVRFHQREILDLPVALSSQLKLFVREIQKGGKLAVNNIFQSGPKYKDNSIQPEISQIN